eukprot:m.82099 g.82099  ORF g.82099 m.82099 type:complete len:229 (+) comp14901_c2_seq2:268-954(+)
MSVSKCGTVRPSGVWLCWRMKIDCYTDWRNAAFSPDGRALVTWQEGSTSVLLWSTADWAAAPRVLERRKPGATDVAFSSDSQMLAVCMSGEVCLWRLPGGEPGPVWREPGYFMCVAFNPTDSTQLAVGGGKQLHSLWLANVGAWEAATLAVERTLAVNIRSVEHRTEGLKPCAFSPDGKQLVASASDDVVYFWDAVSGALLRVVKEARGDIGAFAYSPSGKQLCQVHT